jgi:RNA polymerase sigma factor (sigma-70 family)
MNEMSETELLQAFRKERSEEAFAELVRRYAGLVYSVAHRRLSNAALAEDVTQLVFIRFAKTPPKVNSAGELAAWLHRTTVNVTIDTWRSETRRRNREQQAVAMQQPETNTAAAHAFWDEISPGLDEAIDQLNDDDRQAILLRFFKAKPMRDVGAALGVSEAAAKMRVGRAVDKLRTQLGASVAATTAVVLAGVLAERSAEAAPVQLVSRLVAMKLPAASVAGKGAALHTLSRISKAKVVVGAAGVALVAISVLHFSRPSAPVAQATSHNVAAARTEQHASPVTPAQADLPSLAPPKSVKIQFTCWMLRRAQVSARLKLNFITSVRADTGKGIIRSRMTKVTPRLQSPMTFQRKARMFT